MFTEQLQRERRMLDHILKHHRVQLTDEGILICHRHGRFVRWVRRYWSGEEILNKPVSKNDWELAQRLAMNHYRLAMIEEIRQKITEIDRFLQKCPGEERPGRKTELRYHLGKKPRHPAEFLHNDSPYSELLLPVLQEEYRWVIDWYRDDYPRNTEKPERLVFPTEAGFSVRSKSEVLGTNRLVREGVLFHYEEKLILPGDVVYPDWMIPLTRQERIAWEHNGAMDMNGYNYRTRAKVINYLEGQWLPGVNMIDTYESRERPFSEEDLDHVMEWLVPKYREAFPDLPPDGSFTLYDMIRGA